MNDYNNWTDYFVNIAIGLFFLTVAYCAIVGINFWLNGLCGC